MYPGILACYSHSAPTLGCCRDATKGKDKYCDSRAIQNNNGKQIAYILTVKQQHLKVLITRLPLCHPLPLASASALCTSDSPLTFRCRLNTEYWFTFRIQRLSSLTHFTDNHTSVLSHLNCANIEFYQSTAE